MAISLPVFAEGTNLLDEFGDIMSGRKDNVELHPYVAYTTKDTFKIGSIPIIPKNLRIKYSPGKLGKDDNVRIHRIDAGLEF